MKVIPNDALKKLLQDSITLQKASGTIAALKHALHGKQIVIRDLQKKVRLYEKVGKNSSVSVLVV